MIIVFGCNQYYPAGGDGDALARFDDIEQLRADHRLGTWIRDVYVRGGERQWISGEVATLDQVGRSSEDVWAWDPVSGERWDLERVRVPGGPGFVWRWVDGR